MSYETDTTVPYAQLFARDVRAELRINDIPVATAEPGELVSQATPVRSLLLTGQNTITLDLGETDAPAQRGGWSDQAIAHCRIAIFESGQSLDPDAGDELAGMQVAFSSEMPNPVRRSGTFDSAQGGGWAWASAPVIDVNQPNVIAGLSSFMAMVHAAFVRRDMATLLPLYAPVARDFARAYPAHTFEDVMAQFAAKFDGFDSGPWEVRPFTPERAVYRPLAGGRLVQALHADGGPLVRTVDMPPEGNADDPTFCGFVELIGVFDGRLQVLG